MLQIGEPIGDFQGLRSLVEGDGLTSAGRFGNQTFDQATWVVTSNDPEEGIIQSQHLKSGRTYAHHYDQLEPHYLSHIYVGRVRNSYSPAVPNLPKY